ncbi:MAG: NADH-quinone oxidoreductase subunit NuoH [Desulfurococcales archaeon]|nr:NADH-quinone oxidoreductase subunit NuoH [Desulfurococcales archaeon]
MAGVVDTIISWIFWPPLFQLVIAPGLVAALAIVIFILWFERKTAARVQMRVGPYNVSPRLGGALQLIADLIRYSFQEPIIPKTVDTAAFILAPLAMLVISVVPTAAIPVSPLPWTWPIPMEHSLLVALALTTLSPVFLVAAGWASNNKFSVIGSTREAFMVTAYELVFIISLLAVAAPVHSYNLVEIVEAQAGWRMFAILNPLAFLAAFIAILMSTSGFPFEIPESEHEVVAGPFTEYSGLLYGIDMGAAYIKRYVMSVLLTIAFLGGWKPLDPQPGAGLLAGYIAPLVVVLVKATIVMAVMSFFRAVYGRYRLDQAVDLAWRVILPMALAGYALGLIYGYLGVI